MKQPVVASLDVFGLTAVAVVARLAMARRLPITDTNDQVTFGLFPHDLLHGLQGPPTAYLPELHQGCAVLWGLACAPVFAAAGPTFGALRGCSLLWHALLVLAFVALARVVGGRTGAGVAAALFVLAPPLIVRSASIGLPDHVDAAALLAASLLCLLAARRIPGGRPRWWGGASGALAGLAVVFLFDAVFAGVAIGAGAALRSGDGERGWDGERGPIGPWLAGAAVGLSPFLTGIGFWRTPKGQEVFARLLPGGADAPAGEPLHARVASLVTRDAPHAVGLLDHSPGFGLTVPGASASWVYLGALLALVAVGVVAEHREGHGVAARVAALAAGLHLAGCVGSGLSLQSWGYLLPIWPWLVLGAAIGGAHLLRGSNRARGVGAITIAVPLLLALPGPTVAALESPEPAGPELRAWVASERGYNLLTHRLGYERLLATPARALLASSVRRADHRLDLLRLAGRAAWHEGGAPSLLALADGVPSLRADLLALGAGREATRRASEEGGLAPMRAAERMATDGGAHATAAFRAGAGRGVFTMLSPPYEDADWGALSPLAADAVCFGLGMRAAERSEGTGPFDAITRIPACDEARFAAGFGLATALRHRAGTDPGPPPALREWAGREVSAEAQAAYRCALDAALVAVRTVSAGGAGAGSWGWDCGRRTP